MLRPRTFYIVLSLATLVLISCTNRQTVATLNDIETYIQARPDSALATICAIDTTTLTTRSIRAHYALLYAMALDKSWIDTTDVNVVMPAVEYYAKHRKGDCRAKAWYYLGRIQYNSGNYSDAILSFTRAANDMEKLDERFKALICHATSDTYGATYLPEESFLYSSDAYRHALAAGDTLLANASLYRMAQGLANLKRVDEADSVFRFLIADTLHIDSRVYPRILSDYALLQAGTFEDYGKAVSYFKESIKISHGLSKINYWCSYAYSLAETGDESRADAIFRKLESSSGTYPYMVWKSRTEALKHNFETAYLLQRESSDIQSDNVIKSLRQSAVKAQRDYFAMERAKAEESRRLVAWIAVLSVLALLFAAVAGYLLLQRRNRLIVERSKSLEIENRSLQDAFSSLSDQMMEMKLQQAQLQREYTKHLQATFREWSSLYKAYYRHSGKEDPHRDVRDEVFFEARNAVTRLSGDKEGQALLEGRLNTLFGDVMRHYRAEFPGQEEIAYRYVSFVFAGFETAVMKMAFQIPSMAAAYERKSRLKDAISRSDAPHKELFLRLLQK